MTRLASGIATASVPVKTNIGALRRWISQVIRLIQQAQMRKAQRLLDRHHRITGGSLR